MQWLRSEKNSLATVVRFFNTIGSYI